jgi:ribonucleoside-diphosphate reductase alpha chain
MTGIGNDYQIASLSNCFVIGNDGIADSYGGIMKIDQEQVQLMKRRGGVGHDLSHISPRFTVLNTPLLQQVLFPLWRDIPTPPARLHRTEGAEH